MAQDRKKVSKAAKLSSAIQESRSKPLTSSDMVVRNTSSQPSRALKQIKFPNNSSALRQHLEESRVIERRPIEVRIRRRAPTTQPITTESPVAPAAQPEQPAQKVAPRSRPALYGAPTNEPVVIKTVLSLGDVVRHARKRRGMSQADLAELAATGRRFISELEAGKPTIEFDRLLKVCRALDIELFANEPKR